MMNDLEKLVEEARARFDAVADEAGLADAKAAFLGKSGALTALLKGLASLTGAEKAERGKALNQVKQRIEALLNARIEAIRAERLAQRLASERLDVSNCNFAVPITSRRWRRSSRMAFNARTRPSLRVRRALMPWRIQTSSCAKRLSNNSFCNASTRKFSSFVVRYKS